jgi:2-amino-4-hydroxy-6-hydroxymethyldihydropteridine diphosphokinase
LVFRIAGYPKGYFVKESLKNSILALGGNEASQIGDPRETVQFALGVMQRKGVVTLKLSYFYATPAVPAGSGPDYVNAAALVQSPFEATELLEIVHEVEADLGRKRVVRWGSRPVDIDLISHEDEVRPSRAEFERWRDLPLEKQGRIAPEELILPHPRMQDRAFVLVPVLDVAPDWVHPVSGLSVAEMVKNLPEKDVEQVVRL